MNIEDFIAKVLETELTPLQRGNIQEYLDYERDLPEVMFRELISRLNCITRKWVVPDEIYHLIDSGKLDAAQSLLDKQKEQWNCDDLEINRAQSYIDMVLQ